MSQICDCYEGLKIHVSRKRGRVYELIIDIERRYSDQKTFTCFVISNSESHAECKALAIGRDFYDKDMDAEEYQEYFTSDVEFAIYHDAGVEL